MVVTAPKNFLTPHLNSAVVTIDSSANVRSQAILQGASLYHRQARLGPPKMRKSCCRQLNVVDYKILSKSKTHRLWGELSTTIC